MKRFSEERKTVGYDQFDNTIQQILEAAKKILQLGHECMSSDRRYQTKLNDYMYTSYIYAAKDTE